MVKQYKRRKERSKGRLSEAAYLPERGRDEGNCKYSGARDGTYLANKERGRGEYGGGRAGGIGGPAQEETMEAAVLGQEICGNNSWMR